jgi:hypothetical protein
MRSMLRSLRWTAMQTPRHVGYTPPATLSRNLHGCSAYGAGDQLRAHCPTAPGTVLTVFAVTTDAQLGKSATPNGGVAFLQWVRATAADKTRMVAGRAAEVVSGVVTRH